FASEPASLLVHPLSARQLERASEATTNGRMRDMDTNLCGPRGGVNTHARAKLACVVKKLNRGLGPGPSKAAVPFPTIPAMPISDPNVRAIFQPDDSQVVKALLVA